ncbi:MAG: hypothetical protein QM638_17250 [Nocardioides sp.]
MHREVVGLLGDGQLLELLAEPPAEDLEDAHGMGAGGMSPFRQLVGQCADRTPVVLDVVLVGDHDLNEPEHPLQG